MSMTSLDADVLIGSKVTFSRVPVMLLKRVKRSCLNTFTIDSIKALVDVNNKIKLVIVLKELPDVYVDGDCLVLEPAKL